MHYWLYYIRAHSNTGTSKCTTHEEVVQYNYSSSSVNRCYHTRLKTSVQSVGIRLSIAIARPRPPFTR